MRIIYWTYDGCHEAEHLVNVPLAIELHRDDGPAIIVVSKTNTSKQWIKHGIIHREDGPAIINISSSTNAIVSCYWRIRGIDKTKEINQWMFDNKIPHWEQWDNNIKTRFKLTWI